MSALESWILVALILASAYIAAAEVALFSLSRFQLRQLKERSKLLHKRIKKLLSDPGGLLVTVLVVNEVLNIAISTLITRGIAQGTPGSKGHFLHAPDWAMHALLGTLISAPIILVVCDITPKAAAARVNTLIASATIKPVTFIYQLLRPIRFILKRVVASVSRWAGRSEPMINEEAMLKESDFLLMVEEGHKEGALHASEVELIKNVFELDDTTVEDVFTPLTEVKSLPHDCAIRDALVAIRTFHYSRVPVTSANRREVLGILYSKDLLRAKLEPEQLDLPISQVMLDPVFVLPTMKLNTLFRRFKQQKSHMAIVQRHTGDTLGIITMADVVDTLFGELFPEEDE